MAIHAQGVSNVRLRNVNARGWETGLKVENAQGWQVENCDFSRNFHDPSFGWGENGRRGGIILVEHVDGLGTEGPDAAARWDRVNPRSRVTFAMDSETKIVGQSSLRALINPYGGERVNLRVPAGSGLNLALQGKSTLVFWIKVLNENVPAWQNTNPVVTLYESPSRFAKFEAGDLLSSPPYNEARDGWTYVVVPLQGDSLWKREGTDDIATLNSLTLGFDSWGARPLRIWIDGLAIK